LLALLSKRRFLAEETALLQQSSMARKIKVKATIAYIVLSNQLVPMFIEHWEILTNPSLVETIRSILFLS
jgi:hypothetical protein